MKKTKYIQLVLVSGILAACSQQKDPKQALYDRLHVRTDTSGVYTYGEPGYELYPYGQMVDGSNNYDNGNGSGYGGGYYGGYGFFYHPVGYGSGSIAPGSSIESAHISRGGFGASAFHVSS